MIDWLKKMFRSRDSDKIKISLELDDGKYYEEFVEEDNCEERIAELQKQFDSKKPLDQTTFIWCLIGNIIEKKISESESVGNDGTKHFSPNTKVYCFPPQWGDGYEKIKVIGRHKKTRRNICIVMPSKNIANWRLQKVYRPYILEVMYSERGWTDREKDKNTILEMVKSLNNKLAENN